MPGFTVSWSLLKLMSIESVMPSNQPSHPLSSPSPPALNLSQHQGLLKWVSSSHQVAKILEFQLQHHSFQWTHRTDFLYDGLVGSACSPRDSQESSPIPQFINMYSSVLSFLHNPTLTSIHDSRKTIALATHKWNATHFSLAIFLRVALVVFLQLLSHVWFFVTPWTVACHTPLSFTISWSLLKFMSVESVMLSNHFFLCHSLLLLPPIFSRIRVFSNESALHNNLYH